jgi:hypothetical protein
MEDVNYSFLDRDEMRREVHFEIEGALERVYSEFYAKIMKGRLTPDIVREALDVGWDLGDHFWAYWTEGENE